MFLLNRDCDYFSLSNESHSRNILWLLVHWSSSRAKNPNKRSLRGLQACCNNSRNSWRATYADWIRKFLHHKQTGRKAFYSICYLHNGVEANYEVRTAQNGVCLPFGKQRSVIGGENRIKRMIGETVLEKFVFREKVECTFPRIVWDGSFNITYAERNARKANSERKSEIQYLTDRE